MILRCGIIFSALAFLACAPKTTQESQEKHAVPLSDNKATNEVCCPSNEIKIPVFGIPMLGASGGHNPGEATAGMGYEIKESFAKAR